MYYLIVVLIIIVILGAIFGGDSFGDTVRTGIGYLIGILIAIFVVVFLFASSDAYKSDTSPNGYKLSFTNNCKYPVNLAIRYKDVNDNWKNVGWWLVDGHESHLLSSGGDPVATNAESIFFYAETEDGSYQWEGAHEHHINGRTLKMIEFKDKHGITEWNIDCRKLN